MTPKTTQANLAYWAAALAGAVLLAFLTSITVNWPEDGSVDWRSVTLDVVQTLVTILPVVLAGLGLPRLGKEGVAALVNEVGTEQAKAALEVEAIKQETGVSGPVRRLSDEDVDRLARRGLELMREEAVAEALSEPAFLRRERS